MMICLEGQTTKRFEVSLTVIKINRVKYIFVMHLTQIDQK